MTAAAAWATLAFSTAVTAALLVALAPPHPSARLVEPLAAAVGLVAGVALALGLRALRADARHPVLRGSAAQLGLLALFAANEEVVWRRVVLGELLRGGALAALAASTIVFALAHRRRPGLHVLTGAVFGALYVGTGALAAPIAGHWAYNATLAVGRRPRLEGTPP